MTASMPRQSRHLRPQLETHLLEHPPHAATLPVPTRPVGSAPTASTPLHFPRLTRLKTPSPESKTDNSTATQFRSRHTARAPKIRVSTWSQDSHVAPVRRATNEKHSGSEIAPHPAPPELR